MAYTINKYNTTQLAVVEDGTLDQTTALKLVGKNINDTVYDTSKKDYYF